MADFDALFAELRTFVMPRLGNLTIDLAISFRQFSNRYDLFRLGTFPNRPFLLFSE